MRHLLNMSPKLVLLMMLTLALSLTLVGCSDDDDDNNNNPTDPGGVTVFDQAFAAQQAQMMVPLVIDMVENMTLYAGGLDPINKADDIYEWAWNGDTGRWEGVHVSSAEGMSISYSGWLQYLDDMGTPQQDAEGAATFAYQNVMSLAMTFVGDGTSVTIDMDTEESFSASGLNTGTILVSGNGSADIEVSEGNSGSSQFAYSWQTLGNGISYPLNGCPTGSMEFSFAPFRVEVAFNGTGTASYTMYNNTTMIPEGTGTEPLDCGLGR